MEFDVLGPLRLRDDTGAAGPLSRMQQVLLGVLLARAGTAVSVDQLADALWDGLQNDRAAQRLQVHVHKLRRTLGDPARVSFGMAGYRLAVLPGELDVDRFTDLIARGQAADDPRERAELLRSALALWRGTPFGGLDVPVLADEARRLVELRLVTLDQLYEAELAAGGHAAVVAELSGLARDHPLHERFAALLMTALHRVGRRAAALDVYRETRSRFVSDLGLEPSSELRDLERRILADEPEPPRPVARAVAAPPPAQLPHAAGHLVGREAALAGLSGLAGTGRVCVVTGTAGVGKTALAIHWGHLARELFPDGQLFVDLRGYGPGQPVSPHEALGGFLRALGVDGVSVPADPAERAARFRSLVDHRRLLLVLDNARNAPQVRPLLPGSSSCFVLVTSRDSLGGLVARDGAHRLGLDLLGRADAVALLTELTGGGRDPATMRAVADRCARLPLALRIAAEAVRGPWPATGPDHRGLDLFDDGGDPETDIRTVFFWSYDRLPAEAARVFRLLGLHPAPAISPDAVHAMAGGARRVTDRAIDTLVRAHLVEDAGGRLVLHDLLHAYAAERAAADEDPEARRRLYRWYADRALAARRALTPGAAPIPHFDPPETESVFADAAAGMAWFNEERGNLAAIVGDAAAHGEPTIAWQVTATMLNYLNLTKYWDDWLDLYTAGLAAARQAGDPAGEGFMLNGLGVRHDDLREFDEAITCHRMAATCYAAAGEDHGAAWNLNNLGVAFDRAGRLAEAVEQHHAALALFRAVGNQVGEALSLNNVGDVHRQLGAYDDAERALTAALDLQRASGDHAGQRFTQGSLGHLHHDRGDVGQARTHYQAALAISRELGDRMRTATLLTRLAALHETEGQFTAAVDTLHRALTELGELTCSDLADTIRARLGALANPRVTR